MITRAHHSSINMHTCCTSRSRRRRRPTNIAEISSSAKVIQLLTTLGAILACGSLNTTTALQSSIKIENSGYSGITLTFSNQLNMKDFVKEDLMENVQRFIRDSSTFIYDALDKRVYFSDVQILIPYRWNSSTDEWHPNPGQPVTKNRRTLYKEADILVGFDDPIFGQMPYTIQHDGCAQYGHKIHLPINYTVTSSDRTTSNDKSRAFIREWTSYRYGVFKENGYRNDPMYPPFYSVPGSYGRSFMGEKIGNIESTGCQDNTTTAHFIDQPLSGFDSQGMRCSPEVDPTSGFPLSSSYDCLPYPVAASTTAMLNSQSNNLTLVTDAPISSSIMYGDWSYDSSVGRTKQSGSATRWHFCGEQFPSIDTQQQQHLSSASDQQQTNQIDQIQTTTNSRLSLLSNTRQQHYNHYHHDSDAPNKQNIMCQQRSAMDVIKQSADFEPNKFSKINKLPATNFHFIKEEPPRFIIGVEYTKTLMTNSKRMDSELLDAAIKKFLALDLIANSEVAVVWFGRDQSFRSSFKKLDNNIDSRMRLYSPKRAAFNEPGIGELGNEQSQCSFAKVMSEVQSLRSDRNSGMDVLDMDCDLVVITSGNFIEEEYQIEELHKTLRTERLGLHLIIYPLQKSPDEFQHNLYIRKLAYIQKLFNAKIHFIKEHLDVNGDVKMTTLLQFFEIFDYMGKGHSWDQHDSHTTLKNQNVNGTDLKFYFDIDSSIENELIVGFIETKKFDISNLQLRSPSGIVFNEHEYSDSLFEYRDQLKIAGFHLKQLSLEAGTWLLSASSEKPIQTAATAIAKVNNQGNTTIGNCWIQPQYSLTSNDQQSSTSSGQLKQTTVLKSIKVFVETNNDHTMPYVQDISARMEVHDDFGDIVQNVEMLDDGLAMPDITQGDGIHSQYVVRAQKAGYYKVFVDLAAGMASSSPIAANQDYPTDPLTSNDYDVITNYPSAANYRQQALNATRSSASRMSADIWRQTYTPHAAAIKAQRTDSQYSDTPCCGSFIPPIAQKSINSRYLNRQLYCGTFYLDESIRLAEQKPARVNNLRVTKVDRAQRKVTVQWTEPMVDMSSYSLTTPNKPTSTSMNVTTNDTDVSSDQDSDIFVTRNGKRLKRSSRSNVKSKSARLQESPSRSSEYNLSSNSTIKNGKDTATSESGAKYEIKSFEDMNSLKDSLNVVNYNSLNVDGSFPVASNYGGTKEVVLRIPYTKEGVYYIVMRTYNNLGTVSDYSNIVKFVLAKNITYPEDSYNQFGTGSLDGYSGDASVLDDLTASSSRHNNGNILESLVVMTALTVAAFISVVSLVAVGCCIYNSKNKSSMMSNNSEEAKVVAGNGSSASSSTSGCNSDIASSAASSQSGQDVDISKSSLSNVNNTNSSNGLHHDHLHHQQQYSNLSADISTLNINMPYLHHIHNTLPSPVSSTVTVNHQNEQQSHHLYHHHHHHHNLVGTLSKLDSIQNGVSGLMLPRSISQEKLSQCTISRDYATPSSVIDTNHQHSNSGLVTAISPVQSWPADILLSHYDKVKQAKERNEIPPVMRIENLDHTTLMPSMLGLTDLATHKQSNNSNLALDKDDTHSTATTNISSNIKNQRLDRQSYINQQLQQRLQQQLNNVIPNGSNNILRTSNHHHRHSPHQVEGTNIGSRAIMYEKSQDRLDDFMQQAPPQYVYYNQNHLFDTSNTATQQQQQKQLENQASSIYGQTISNNLQNSCYYANQQQPPSPWTTVDRQHEQGIGDADNGYQQTISTDGYASVKKPSSAVSQV